MKIVTSLILCLAVALLVSACRVHVEPQPSEVVVVSPSPPPPPPKIVIRKRPRLVVVPGFVDVYFCPDLEVDVFFYGGLWYCRYRGFWYYSRCYCGPWVYIARPPAVLLKIPPGFRKHHHRKHWHKRRGPKVY